MKTLFYITFCQVAKVFSLFFTSFTYDPIFFLALKSRLNDVLTCQVINNMSNLSVNYLCLKL